MAGADVLALCMEVLRASMDVLLKGAAHSNAAVIHTVDGILKLSCDSDMYGAQLCQWRLPASWHGAAVGCFHRPLR